MYKLWFLLHLKISHHTCFMTLFSNSQCCIFMTCYHHYCLNDNVFINRNTFVTYSWGCPGDVLRIILQSRWCSHHLSLQSQIHLWHWLFHLHNKMHVQWEGSLSIAAKNCRWIWKQVTGSLWWLHGVWHERDRQKEPSIMSVCVLYDIFKFTL